MPSLPVRVQQPSPVPPQVELPPEFPDVPQEVLDRFPSAKDWQNRLDEFWTRAKQGIQSAQTQAANFANSRVTFSVDTFRIYAKNGISEPMFALDSSGVKLGDVLTISTRGRKVFIGLGDYADDNTPFYVDTDGKFSLGSKLTWEPSTAVLTITGTIIATSGTIGGFDIGADYIRDTANSMGMASTVTGGDDVRFWSGDTFANRASAPFRVLESGIIVATAAAITGTISGRSTATIASTIDVSGIVVTDLINARLNTSAKTMLSDFTFGAADYSGALKSGTITWNTTTGAITGGSGVLVYRGGIIGAASGVATFTLDAATGNATFAGTVVATAGSIGGFDIGSNYIRDAADSFGMSSAVTGGDDVRFWAGDTFANRATAPFMVTEAGAITATNATFTNNVTISTVNPVLLSDNSSYLTWQGVSPSNRGLYLQRETSDVGVHLLTAQANPNSSFRSELYTGSFAAKGACLAGALSRLEFNFATHNTGTWQFTSAELYAYADENLSSTAKGTSLEIHTNANGNTIPGYIRFKSNEIAFKPDLFGTFDTNLYRSAANTLKTDDAFIAAGTVSPLGLLDISGASAGQIKFPATQNASADANTLDDYEEGTFTPSLGGSATYTTQTGIYTKIGRSVYFQIRLTVNTIGTGSTTTISGLPFAASAVYGTCSIGYFDSLATNVIALYGYVNPSASTIGFSMMNASGATVTNTPAIFGSGTDIILTGHYSV